MLLPPCQDSKYRRCKSSLPLAEPLARRIVRVECHDNEESRRCRRQLHQSHLSWADQRPSSSHRNRPLIGISGVRRLLCKEVGFLSVGERSRRWLSCPQSPTVSYQLWGLCILPLASLSFKMLCSNLPVCIIWHSEWRKSRPCKTSFRKALRIVGGNPTVPRCRPRSQRGSLSGSNTIPRCSPKGPGMVKESWINLT